MKAMLTALLGLSVPLAAQHAFPMGLHRMAIDSPGGALGFDLLLEGDGEGKLLAFVINGGEKVDVPEVEDLADGRLRLSFPHYDSELLLELRDTEGALRGHWIKRRGEGKPTRMAVHNQRDAKPLHFTMAADAPLPDWFAGRYRVAFTGSKTPAVGVFAPRRGAYTSCEGTFLTTLGDYRYLGGTATDDTLELSVFDGAHAFLFRARRQADGALQGDFWSSDDWHDTWTATRDDDAALPDGWGLTKWNGDAKLADATYRDLFGAARSLDDAAWRGKVRVIEVFGSWCPNCHDHGHYMADLHRRYRERGLQVIGVAFERDDDFRRSVRQVRAFAARHDATFPLLIGGLADKQRATEQLGLLDRVRAYPTTIFVDKRGAVRGIYQGWSGPATGGAHEHLKERFEALVETLLAEAP